MEVLGIFMLVGAFAGVGIKATEASSQADDIRSAIASQTLANQSLQARWNAVLSDISSLTPAVVQDINTQVQLITVLAVKTKATRDLHAASFRTMQIIALIGVALVGLLLVGKRFGITQIITQILGYPFNKH